MAERIRILKPARYLSLLGMLIFPLALWFLHLELGAVHFAELARGLESLPLARIVLALGLTAAAYFALGGYDAAGARYAGHPLPFRRTALISFLGNAVGNNVGGSLVPGGSIRMRLYALWGVSAEEIANVVAFGGLGYWMGFLALAGALFTAAPWLFPAGIPMSTGTSLVAGAAVAAPVVAYLSTCAFRRTPLRLANWTVPLPPLSLAAIQVAVGALDWTLAAGVLYVLLPPAGTPSFPAFLIPFLIAQLLGTLSQVPGGLAVFELGIVALLSPGVGTDALIAALLAYRTVYYLLPIALATIGIAAYESVRRNAALLGAARATGAWIPRVTPTVLAIVTFAGGVTLLLSGAIPAERYRLAWLADFLPLPVMELSHFLGSVTGVGLLFLANGLRRRLDSAYFLSAGLLAAGALFSLFKSLDYEEASALLLMLLALLPCRSHFYRRASLFTERFTADWLESVVLALLGMIWLGIFSFKHVQYSRELWWKFVLFGGAPRFLRAAAGASIAAAGLSVWKLLRPASPRPVLPEPAELEQAARILQRSGDAYANLCLLGDKALLLGDRGDAFLMYGVQGRTWVALGDPVGPEEERAELAWRFHELSDRRDGWTVFYRVRPEHLPVYLDLGLTPLKVGEEARVRLDTFSLEGSARSEFRQIERKLTREGVTFEIVQPDAVRPLLPELKAVSDAWLRLKNAREKGFSLGFFDEAYLERFPSGVVRKQGRILAFATLLPGPGQGEIATDLMRHAPGSPNGIMDFLFVRSMLWGKNQGYRWYNLGMAPLSGMGDRSLNPLWNQVGSFLFRHGERFYNFQGVRRYKEKFAPVWEPRYLVSPAGVALPRILANIETLISRGIGGAAAR